LRYLTDIKIFYSEVTFYFSWFWEQNQRRKDKKCSRHNCSQQDYRKAVGFMKTTSNYIIIRRRHG
jgi:hypothetical protein